MRSDRRRGRRVIHAGEANEHKVALDFLGSQARRRVCIQVSIGGAKHAQGLLRHRAVLGRDALPIVLRHGTRLGARVYVGATRQQQVRRAIDEGSQPPVGHPAHHRAPLAVRVERDFVVLRQLALDALFVAASFEAAGEQRALRWVAHDAPRSVFEDEVSVVTTDENRRQFEQRPGVARVRRLAFPSVRLGRWRRDVLRLPATKVRSLRYQAAPGLPRQPGCARLRSCEVR